MNVPFPAAVMQVIGMCSHVCQDGTLGINIENIVLNVLIADSAAVSAANAPLLPSKKNLRYHIHTKSKVHK
jgi:hypothetical protein